MTPTDQPVYATGYNERNDIWALLELIRAKQPPFMSDPRRHCAGMNPEWFYINDIRAQNACNGNSKFDTRPCPFRKPCLEYALENNEGGMWGGTSERERRRIVKARARAEAARSTRSR